MASTLTGASLIGTVSGTIAPIESCTIGGLEINVINFAANNDTNGVTNCIPGTVTEGPMTATVVYTSAVQAALRAKALLRTTETWTFADSAGTPYDWVGTGFISSVSGVDSDPDSEDTFTLTITPSTKWTYAAV